MARGGTRLGAGRPRKPLQDHWLRGTHRVSRHGELPRHVHLLTQAPDDWRPASADLDSLGDAGRAFVSRLLEGFTVSNAAEGVVLLEAAHAADALAAIRALSMDGKTAGEVNTMQRLEIAWSRQLASLLAQLRISHEATTN